MFKKLNTPQHQIPQHSHDKHLHTAIFLKPTQCASLGNEAIAGCAKAHDNLERWPATTLVDQKIVNEGNYMYRLERNNSLEFDAHSVWLTAALLQ